MHRDGKRSWGKVFAAAIVAAGLGGCSGRTPELTFKDAQGDVRTIADTGGGVMVLAFTNTWCEPCLQSALHLQGLHQQFADRGVRIVFVSAWERGDPAAFLQEHGFTYGLMLNGTAIARDFSVKDLPTFCIVGPDGKVVARYEGFSADTTDKLARSLDKYLRRYEQMGQNVAHTQE